VIKEKLITYNLEDCSALELVASTVSQAYQLSIGSNAQAAGGRDVVVADKLDSKTTMLA